MFPSEQRAGERDAGLLSGRQCTDRDLHVDALEADRSERFARPLDVGAPVDLAELRGEAIAERQVLDRRQPLDEAEILVHEPDPVALGGTSVAEFQRFTGRVVAVVDRRGLVAGRLVIAGEHFDQRRLARPVLPDERVCRTRLDRQVDVVERDLAREHLRQMLDPQQCRHASPVSANRPPVRFLRLAVV